MIRCKECDKKLEKGYLVVEVSDFIRMGKDAGLFYFCSTKCVVRGVRHRYGD